MTLDETTFKLTFRPIAAKQLALNPPPNPVNLEQFVSDMYSLFQGTYTLQPQSQAAIAKAPAMSDSMAIDPCILQIATVVLDCFGLLAALMSCGFAVKSAATKLLNFIGARYTYTKEIAELCTAISEAKTYSRAAAYGLVQLFFGGMKLAGLKALIRIVVEDLSWYDYLLIGTAMAAQFLAWFGTLGFAIVGEIIGVIVSATSLIIDASRVSDACSKQARPKIDGNKQEVQEEQKKSNTFSLALLM